jgi:peptide/nickel transport system ATP-binding protein
MTGAPVLSVSDLSVSIKLPDGQTANVLDKVSLNLCAGESIGIAGESGSGKSTLLLALMGVLRSGLILSGGSVVFEGHSMLGRPDEALLAIRGGRLALIPQNAAVSLTPNLRIGRQIDEALALHSGLDPAARAWRVIELMERVQLPTPELLARRYPHELSGGQVQRAAIAMALAGGPSVLLMDEPTTGLDVTTQLALLELIIHLQKADGLAIICVSHDLGVLAKCCERLGVMYSGALVEEGPTEHLLSRPAHPYTRALLASLPTLSHPGIPNAIAGQPPSPLALPQGCRFAPRCAHVQDDCRISAPDLTTVGNDRRVACFYPQDRAPEALIASDSDAPPDSAPLVLKVERLSVSYGQARGLNKLLQRRPPMPVVNEVSFELRQGEVLGLVGESGSGKSTILRAIAGIHAASGGSITQLAADGRALVLAGAMADRTVLQLRTIQIVFQNADSSLNPRHRIVELLAQPLGLYAGLSGAAMRARAEELMADVRLGADYLDRYPAQLSGGERQRVAVARAFAAEPDLLLCDEITTALDISVQAAVLNLVRDLARRRNVATIFVSHDLAVVRAISDRIAVLSGGRIVEIGAADTVCRRPAHAYTRTLLAAVLEPKRIEMNQRAGVDHAVHADFGTAQQTG